MEKIGDKRGWHTQNGSVLLILSFLMFFVVTAGVGLAALQLSNSKVIWANHDANQAYYLAESGVEEGLASKSPGTFRGTVKDCDNQPIGTYDATLSVNASGSTIVSRGNLNRDGGYVYTLGATFDPDWKVIDWYTL